MNGKVRLASPVASVRAAGSSGPDGCAALVDTFEHHLVLAHVQALAAGAADRLHADLGRSPQVVNRRVPCLPNRLPIFVEQRLGVRAYPHRDGYRVDRPSEARASCPITVA